MLCSKVTVFDAATKTLRCEPSREFRSRSIRKISPLICLIKICAFKNFLDFDSVLLAIAIVIVFVEYYIVNGSCFIVLAFVT